MRVIHIFFSTPSDVEDERVQLAALVRDINDTIQYIAPEREVRLELVSYETHAFPDIGKPQDVIDRQIPLDFDIYFGIMWKRAGTPTGDSPSGTIHEFEAARLHREQHGWPVIMFFFCDESISMPDTEEDVRQLREVVAFRKRLSSLALMVMYPSRAEFREQARGRLLRAVADVIRAPRRTPGAPPDEPEPVVVVDAVMRELAVTYSEVRASMQPGHARTRRMQQVFNDMVARAGAARASLHRLQASESAGERLAAIATLAAFPDAGELDWLSERLDNPTLEAPFVGYQAAAALAQAVRSLPVEKEPALRAALTHALEFARRLPDDPDRIRVLQNAVAELDDRVRRDGS